MTERGTNQTLSRDPGLSGGGNDAELLDLVIVGAGVSGLALAREVLERRAEWSVALLESEDQPGGTMRSDWVGGCLCEWGPNGFLTNVPHTWDLAHEVGLGERILVANGKAERRYLWVNGALRALPMKPAAFFTSDLLSRRGRARVLLEPFMPRGPVGGDESVFAFASRRIGREAASVLVDAMVSGIYAGDPENLSLQSAFPRMKQMEEEHGSLVKAMIAKMRASRRTKVKSGGPMGPGGKLTSFDEGMQVLIQRLAEIAGPRLSLSTRVVDLEPVEGGYRIDTIRNGSPWTLRARRVALATPSFAGQAILKRRFASVARTLEAIPYAGITVACLVYDRQQIAHDLDGFGFIIPRGQGARLLGCIWNGSIFPPHVTNQRVLMRTMVGGARDPEGAALSEGRTVDLVHGELGRMLGGITGMPKATRLFRHPKGIPQYVMGHPERLQRLEQDLREYPGLYLLNNAYRGIGVNDCVREAKALAERLVGGAAGRSDLPATVEAVL
jgi:oxygen-dependent protoporphyrinogen oxidase